MFQEHFYRLLKYYLEFYIFYCHILAFKILCIFNYLYFFIISINIKKINKNYKFLKNNIYIKFNLLYKTITTLEIMAASH